MTYQIHARVGSHRVSESAGSSRLMKLWLQAFRRSGWTIDKIIEVK